MNCHSHDQESKVRPTYIQADKLRCSCALNNHKVKNTLLHSKSIRNPIKDQICVFNEIFFKLKAEIYYVFMNDYGEYYKDECICLYCTEKCFKKYNQNVELDSIFTKVMKNKFTEHTVPNCACKLSYCHPSSDQVIIREIIENENFEVFINRHQIPGAVEKFPYFKKVIERITRFHTKTIECLDITQIQNEPFNPHLENSLLLLECVGICIKNDNYDFSKNT